MNGDSERFLVCLFVCFFRLHSFGICFQDARQNRSPNCVLTNAAGPRKFTGVWGHTTITTLLVLGRLLQSLNMHVHHESKMKSHGERGGGGEAASAARGMHACTSLSEDNMRAR